MILFMDSVIYFSWRDFFYRQNAVGFVAWFFNTCHIWNFILVSYVDFRM